MTTIKENNEQKGINGFILKYLHYLTTTPDKKTIL